MAPSENLGSALTTYAPPSVGVVMNVSPFTFTPEAASSIASATFPHVGGMSEASRKVQQAMQVPKVEHVEQKEQAEHVQHVQQ